MRPSLKLEVVRNDQFLNEKKREREKEKKNLKVPICTGNESQLDFHNLSRLFTCTSLDKFGMTLEFFVTSYFTNSDRNTKLIYILYT